MKNEIKFPKEVTFLKNAIREASSNSAIIHLKYEILQHAKMLEPFDIVQLLKAYFYMNSYEEVITVGDELLKNDCSSLEYDYYILASYLALGESFLARNYLKRSPALSDPYIKILYQEGGANYSIIRLWKNRAYDQVVLTLVLAAFVVDFTSGRGDDSFDPMTYIMLRLIDLLNILVELGYEKQHLANLKEMIEIVYHIRL